MLISVVLFCVWEGAGAWLTEVVPLTCTSGIEGQCPLSSPSSQAGQLRQPQRLMVRCRDILCLLTWQETVFIYERKRKMLLVACSGYFSTASRVEYHCCWETWKYRAWRCDALFFVCCQQWNWSRYGTISQCFYYPHTCFAVVLTSRLSALLSFLLFFPNLSYLSHHLCL